MAKLEVQKGVGVQARLSKGMVTTEASQPGQIKSGSTKEHVIGTHSGEQEVSEQTGSTSRPPTDTEVVWFKGGILSQFTKLHNPETRRMTHLTMLSFPPTDFYLGQVMSVLHRYERVGGAVCHMDCTTVWTTS